MLIIKDSLSINLWLANRQKPLKLFYVSFNNLCYFNLRGISNLPVVQINLVSNRMQLMFHRIAFKRINIFRNAKDFVEVFKQLIVLVKPLLLLLILYLKLRLKCVKHIALAHLAVIWIELILVSWHKLSLGILTKLNLVLSSKLDRLYWCKSWDKALLLSKGLELIGILLSIQILILGRYGCY